MGRVLKTLVLVVAAAMLAVFAGAVFSALAPTWLSLPATGLVGFVAGFAAVWIGDPFGFRDPL